MTDETDRRGGEEVAKAGDGAGSGEKSDGGNEGGNGDGSEVKELLSLLRTGRRHEDPPDLLPGVQKKIRQRSRGKFYGDGWSTSKAHPSTYLVTSLIMLVILLAIYFTMMPGGPLRSP